MRTIRIEANATMILTVPDAGNRSPEDIVLEAEQHINKSVGVFSITPYKNVSSNQVKVGIRLHVKGSQKDIITY